MCMALRRLDFHEFHDQVYMSLTEWETPGAPIDQLEGASAAQQRFKLLDNDG